MAPKPNNCINHQPTQMFAVNKTTVLKSSDVHDEELKAKVEADPMATFEPHENDVLCGRGGSINNHAGNENYRILVNQKKRVYLTARFKREKRLIAASIVTSIRSLNPSGRFLQRDPKTGVWHDIGDTKARDKSSQALREGAPEIRKEIENDRKIMRSNNNEEEEDDDYEDEEEEKNVTTTSPGIFKSPSRDGKAMNYQHVHSVSPAQDMRQHSSPAYPPAHPLQSVPSQAPPAQYPIQWSMNRSNSRDSAHSSRDRSSSHHSPHHHSPSFHHREQRHSSNSHHDIHYEHNRDRHPPSPMEEYRYSGHTKSSSIPAVQSSKSWGTPEGGYASSRAAYSRYHRNSTQDQSRQLNYSSSRGAVNLRDRPDRSPIRSPGTSHHSPYYMSQHHIHQTKQLPSPKRLHQESYDDRHLLAPTPVQPEGQYFDPNTNIRYSDTANAMHQYNTHQENHQRSFKQSSSWAEGDVEGFHPGMPPPSMRLPSWDSDFASNIDNASVTGDINIFDHDVMMADTTPSNNMPPKTDMNDHHQFQIVESRVDKDDWTSRVPGCFNQFMSQDWSKIFHTNSFDGQFCGMDLCAGSDSCNYVLEDDPSKVIDAFHNSMSATATSSHHTMPKQHTQSHYDHTAMPKQQTRSHVPYTNNIQTNNMVINTQETTLKTMHTWDSEMSAGRISPFGSEAGYSKNFEPIPINHDNNDTFVPNMFSADSQDIPPPVHYPMEANYY